MNTKITIFLIAFLFVLELPCTAIQTSNAPIEAAPAPIEQVSEPCGICREDTNEQTPCGHFFHEKCLSEWLASSGGSACPSCGSKIPSLDDVIKAAEDAVTTILLRCPKTRFLGSLTPEGIIQARGDVQNLINNAKNNLERIALAIIWHDKSSDDPKFNLVARTIPMIWKGVAGTFKADIHGRLPSITFNFDPLKALTERKELIESIIKITLRYLPGIQHIVIRNLNNKTINDMPNIYAPNILSIDAADNKALDTRKIHVNNLRALDITNCGLGSLQDPLTQFPELSILIASNNPSLRSITGFHTTGPNEVTYGFLRKLILNNCDLISVAGDFPNLVEFSVAGNCNLKTNRDFLAPSLRVSDLNATIFKNKRYFEYLQDAASRLSSAAKYGVEKVTELPPFVTRLRDRMLLRRQPLDGVVLTD